MSYKCSLDLQDMAAARGIPLEKRTQYYDETSSSDEEELEKSSLQLPTSLQSAKNIQELVRIRLIDNANVPKPPPVSPVAGVAQMMVDGTYSIEHVRQDTLCLTGVDITKGPKFHQGGRFLVLVPFHGYWSSELTLPVEVLKATGYDIDLVTDIPTGYEGLHRFPAVLPVSLDPNFRDQPRGAAQVSKSESELGMKYVLANTPEGQLVRNAADLSDLIPRRPTPSDGPEAIPKYLDDLCNVLELMGNKYEGIIIVGGSGANVDFAYNTSLEPLLQHFCNLGKPITGICYGVTPMAQQRDFATGRPMMEGHYATGHSNRDDWTDFTGYMNEPPLGQTPQELLHDAEQNSKWSSNQGTAGVNLQGALVEATGPTGGYVLPNGTVNAVLSKKDNVILITANTTPDGYPAVLLTLAAIHDRGALNNRAIYIKDLKEPAVSAVSVRCEREQLPPQLS